MTEPSIEQTDAFDDQQLVEAIKTNPSAVSVLYRRHYAAIARYVGRRVATHEDANDIVSEVFMIMVREIGNYRWTGVPFQAWLYRIATSQISRWVRKRKWTRFWSPFDDQMISTEHISSESNRVHLLRKSLLELPCRYQGVLALYHLEDVSIREIADILNTTEGTIKSRLSRGRELLRKKITLYEKAEMSNERRAAQCVLERNEA